MRWKEICNETSSSGATSSANVSFSTVAVPNNGTVIRRGSLGVGFDISKDKGIYNDKPVNNKKRKKKTSKKR